MKKILHRINASVLYVVFLFFIFAFVSAVTAKPESFRFRNGDPVSDRQRHIAIFVFFLMVVVSGYGAFKSAQRDLRLWRKTQKNKKEDHLA